MVRRKRYVQEELYTGEERGLVYMRRKSYVQVEAGQAPRTHRKINLKNGNEEEEWERLFKRI